MDNTDYFYNLCPYLDTCIDIFVVYNSNNKSNNSKYRCTKLLFVGILSVQKKVLCVQYGKILCFMTNQD